MTAAQPDVLSYASTNVITRRRRTVASVAMRWLGRCVAGMFLLLRVSLLGMGYVVIALGQGLRLLLGIAGALLLMLGGLRWHEVRTRLMRGAYFVDRVTLRLVGFVARNPFAPAGRASL